MTRRKLIAGNWKMFGSRAALAELDAIAAAAAHHTDVDVLICPPFPLIAAAAERAPMLLIGGQDAHAELEGAHTGSVSAAMLKEAGAHYVIVGHSERRDAHRETNAQVRAKAEAVIGAGLTAIVCVGECEADRDAGSAIETIERQLAGSVPHDCNAQTLVIAYEPVWAIGTGRTPTTSDLADMHGAIRTALMTLIGRAGEDVRILYGGSVKEDNAAELLGVDNVDGALVGGASLTASNFVPIIEAAAAL